MSKSWVLKYLTSLLLDPILVILLFELTFHWLPFPFLHFFFLIVVVAKLVIRFCSLEEEIENAHSINVIIVGAGFGGLAAAKRLLDVGIKDIVILERSSDVGGTWRSNSYPGVACDVQSHLYSYSFFPNPRWSKSYSGGKEIHHYIRNFASHFQLLKLIRFNQNVRKAEWLNENKFWKVETSDECGTNKEFTAQFLINSSGGLIVPSIPKFKEMESFKGSIFHTANWDHGVDLSKKKVGVIGTGATSVQVIPNIEDKVEKLFLFQRTPAWIPNRKTIIFPAFVKKLFQMAPWIQQIFRTYIYLSNDIIFFLVFDTRSPLRNFIQKMMAMEMQKKLKEKPELVEKLIPKFDMGCKRITPSDRYLKTLTKDHVRIVQEKIDCFTETGIKTGDGQEYELDVVVLATGFDILKHLVSCFKCIGKNGIDLQEQWGDAPSAYGGITVPNFPNFFIINGPSTVIGHNSVVFNIECQVNYILDCIRKLSKNGTQVKAMELKNSVLEDFVRWQKMRVENTVFSSGCNAWYSNKYGNLWTIWPESSTQYWWMLFSCNEKHYIFS